MPKLDNAGESNSIKLSKGVYASLGTITGVTDYSVHPHYPNRKPLLKKDGSPVTGKGGKPLELCLEVKYEREDGQEWTTAFYGNYKVDAVTGRIKGWNAFGNGVQDFLDKLLGREVLENTLNEDYSIPQSLLDMLIGKSFYRISYISGFNAKDSSKGAYKDFNQIFLPDATIEEMQKAWASSAPYLTTYKPDVVDELEKMREEKENGDTSFGYGANDPSVEDTQDNEEFEL